MNRHFNLEEYLVEIMIDENCTLSHALRIVFDEVGVDTNSVFDMVDFLEERLPSLDSVNDLMMVYTGQSPDYRLRFYKKDQ